MLVKYIVGNEIRKRIKYYITVESTRVIITIYIITGTRVVLIGGYNDNIGSTRYRPAIQSWWSLRHTVVIRVRLQQLSIEIADNYYI